MCRLTIAASLLLAALPGMAQAASPPCLTPAEFTAITTYTLPSVIRGTARRCTTQLGAQAFLPRSGSALAERYAADRARAWPDAKAAFLKLSASAGAEANGLIRGLPDASMQPMLDALMEGLVSQRVPLDRCGAIDRVVRLLAPLPPENTAELIAVTVGLGSKAGGGKFGNITLCPA